MGKKLKEAKRNKKSVIYENDDYKVTIKEGGYVAQKNDSLKNWYDSEVEKGELIQAYMNEMIVENKKTGKKASKRVYQEDPIQDLQDDLEDKIKFSDIFKKIDK